MNLVGKIFVFLIFCMSAVFMSFAVVVYATHVNWEQKAKDLKAQIDTEKKRNDDLVSQKSEIEKKLSAELALHRQDLTKSESERAVLLLEQQKQLDAYNKLDANFNVALAKVQTEQQKLVTLRAEVDKLREENRLAREQIDSRFGDVVVLSEKIHQMEGDYRRAKERNDQLVADLTKYKVAADRFHINVDNPPQPGTIVVDGLITGVKRSGQDIYVQLSIGSDDGLQLGYPLEVYRGSTYVGRVVVVRTTPDKSVAKVEGKLNADILPRDRVESRASLKLTAG